MSGQKPLSTAPLRVTHLTKRYGNLTALSDVSFSIRHGEVLGLIGPNGSGKTTLFECLGGVLPLDRGQLMWDGRRLSARERAALFFYLPDAIAPWPAQSVRWALDFASKFFDDTRQPPTRGGRGRAQAASLTLAEVIARLDLAPFLEAPIGT